MVALQVRLSELLEAVDPNLDSTVTADLTGNAILKLLYCLVRIRPNTSVTSLRVNYYHELNAKIRHKFERLMGTTQSGVPAIMQEVGRDPGN